MTAREKFENGGMVSVAELLKEKPWWAITRYGKIAYLACVFGNGWKFARAMYNTRYTYVGRIKLSKED